MFLRSTLLAAAAVVFTSAAFAQAPAAPAAAPAAPAAMAAPVAAPAATPAPEAAKAPGPCKQIVQACNQAGFVKGGHKDGKGLKMDCMQPLMDGKTVTGVTVAGDVLAACKEKRAKWMEMKKQNGGMMGGEKPMMGDKPMEAAPAAPAAPAAK